MCEPFCRSAAASPVTTARRVRPTVIRRRQPFSGRAASLETAVHRFPVRRLIIVVAFMALAVSTVPVSASVRVIQPQVDSPRTSTSAADTSALAISAGSAHTCVIRAAGTITCWGDNTVGVSAPPAGTFTALDAGSRHTCAIRTDATLACWGYNDDGQSTPPTGTFVAVSAGGAHSCGVRTDGTLACWGATTGGRGLRRLEPTNP